MATLRASALRGPMVAAAFSLALLLCVSPATGEEAAAAEAADGAAPIEEEQDETKRLISQLTIAMVTEVVDERTVEIHDSGGAGKSRNMHIQMGNTKIARQGAAHSDEQHAERRAAAKEALTSLVHKQMIWWKAGPDEHQPPAPGEGSKETQVVVGDLWQSDGRHINSLMAKGGHLDHDQQYHSDLARDILTAESEAKKQESYAELEKALKESEKEKRKVAAEQTKKDKEQKKKKQQEKADPNAIGMGGWIVLASMGVLILGAACNFGRGAKKKANLNRKRGPFEKFWMKLKGS